MSRRSKLLVLIFSSVISLGLIIWFIMRPQLPTIKKSLNINTPSLPQATVVPSLPVEQVVPTTPTQTKTIVKKEPKFDLSVTLRSLASIFAARYGSFSNQSDFKNLRDLLPSMTVGFAAENERQIEKQRQSGVDTTVYYGVTSKTIKSELISLNESKTEAKIRLTMQKNESKRSMNNGKVFYQDVIVELRKEGGEWKLDGVEWQD